MSTTIEGPPRPRAEAPGRPFFPIFLTLLFAAAIVVAWVFTPIKKSTAADAAPAAAADEKEKDGKDKEEAAKKEGAAPKEGEAAGKKDEVAAAPAPSEDVKALKAEVDALARRVAQLSERAEAAPKGGPDLKPLEEKVAGLAKDHEAVAALPKKVDDLDGRLGSLDKTIGGLNAEVAALREQARKPAESPSTTKPEAAAAEETAIAPAADLFKQKKYKEASEAFGKLSQSNPDDARVWYYAALANGLATGKWQGETERLVGKGIAREKAGTPKTAEIDAAFADLDKTNGKDWLAYYRKQAAR